MSRIKLLNLLRSLSSILFKEMNFIILLDSISDLIIQIKYDPNLKDKFFFDLKTKIILIHLNLILNIYRSPLIDNSN
ncbi:hypothetical protein BpHYR1_045075 [Brachionus plicatilis]|uniref:Uncharacterized protein n=1 Tax=Brachionus plicatilis TaxID=10195 RepID=A0A3M7SLH2_BRAPC|nr:hypothetical protein BpHYR1_045075 [Brachionus plicatilis]